MRAVTKINIGRTRFVPFDEGARARARKCVTCLVVVLEISLGFDNYAGAFPPDQLSSDKLTCASNRVASEKSCPNNSASHSWNRVAAANRLQAKLLETLCLVINRDLHFTSHRFSVSERRNEFRFAHVLEGGIAESEKWRQLAQEREILQIPGCVDF